MICKEILNGGTEDIRDILHVHEQQYFLLLKRKLPSSAKIIYEASEFQIIDGDTIKGCTTPDFHIQLANGERVIIEITTALKNSYNTKNPDPKGKQKEIMSYFVQSNPNIKFIVLYGETLARLQVRNPGIDFHNAKKIRRG